ncbi:Ornithine decarboxylase, partial [Dispira parvispora]
MPPIPCPTDYVAPTTLSGKACSWTEPPTHDLSVGIATKPRLNIPTDSVGRVLQSHIQDKRAEDSFFVADLGEVYRQYLQWRDWLPRVEPFYAVKCNPDPMVLRLLARLGLGFDCASRAELKKVLDLGVPSHQIVYANPCKQTSHLRFAADHDVRMLTFDNADELYKVKKHHPRAQVLLRVLTDDSKSLCKLGIKFGAPMDSTAQLLQLAHDLDLDVVGVSFHVGSGCQDASPFRDAVQRAR